MRLFQCIPHHHSQQHRALGFPGVGFSGTEFRTVVGEPLTTDVRSEECIMGPQHFGRWMFGVEHCLRAMTEFALEPCDIGRQEFRALVSVRVVKLNVADQNIQRGC